ncbi:hypothetical protein B0H67DRAFT_493495 [Lasiosphaeris hirsuta]|uniref:Zn(2)-C6 fungal-type domain-containing protein n=1 Tax=Lasiosphaeris hirsuta TaxID=260670 RepID=A0AA40DSL9_9PEZI|nr:hypothetical protein B0H67DRAFT_493495 [Lasiosphaeris hirsuta]
MPRSFTSIERDNPPSRRKSCLACTKARRRCDQAIPACQRCAQRSTDCQYPQGTRSKRSLVSVSSTAHASQSGTEQQIESLFDLAATPQASLDIPNSVLEPPGYFLGDLFSTQEYDADTTVFLDTTSQALISPALPRTVLTTSQINKAISSRLQYALDRISASTRQMFLENQTPWCHAHLYDDGMPPSMQFTDALSTAALHAARNDANNRVIRDCIESRVQDLLSSPAPTAPLDLIAHAHALFIYQILRLFDTDSRVRLSCDATMSQLEEAAYALIPHVKFHELTASGQTGQALDILPLYPISATRDFWNSWVFQESARRTLSVILFFVLAYRYVKGELRTKCNQNTCISRSVTLSAHLWQADDPVDFAIAWRNKKHFLMEDARSDDIDEFGKIMLTGLMGKDEAKGWLALRGVAL